MHKILSTLSLIFLFTISNAQLSKEHNVLFIGIDDLNDYLSFLEGHPQVITPNFDRLAEQCITFTNAHCAAPKCAPSRAALMTGIYPHEEYVPVPRFFRDVTSLSDVVTLPQYFKENGYKTMSIGKIFHHWTRDKSDADLSWEIHKDLFGDLSAYISCCNTGLPFAYPKDSSIIFSNTCMQENNYNIPEVGPINISTGEYYETRTANWIANRINDDIVRPFFIAGGFIKPHIPLYAPAEWFNLYKDSIIVPNFVNPNDLDDLPKTGRRLPFENQYARFVECGVVDELVLGYLANVSYIDHCLGIVLDALENSDKADNTILVVWSDHGHHLGEKHHFSKSTLWEESTRVPLMIKIPELKEANGFVNAPVNLMDIYPTLVELCNLPDKNDIGGRSLVPLLESRLNDWEYPSITTLDTFHHSIRTKQYRYTKYANGETELYNHFNDSNEWNNLAENEEYSFEKERLNLQLDNILAGGNGNLNEIPRITWRGPINATYDLSPSDLKLNIPIAVDAYDVDGGIESVEIWQDGNLLSIINEQPFSINWTTDVIGEYKFQAIAKDNEGSIVYSRSNNITIVDDFINNTDSLSIDLLEIFPNPTTDILHLNTVYSPLEVEIYRSNGTRVFNSTLEKSISIDISAYSSGLYYIKVGGNLGYSQTYEIIKL